MEDGLSVYYIFLLESSPISASARTVLFCVIGLLLVVLGFLIAFAVVVRRRTATEDSVETAPPEEILEEAVAELLDDGPVTCPACFREYVGGLKFCPRDASRLLPSEDLTGGERKGGVCPSCTRAFGAGIRYCPHDASALSPHVVHEATRVPESLTGVVAKICPQCRHRDDLAVSFCGKDGSEMVVIN